MLMAGEIDMTNPKVAFPSFTNKPNIGTRRDDLRSCIP
jgi:hypothetical protein